MTVREVFNHFDKSFSKISYTDSRSNNFKRVRDKEPEILTDEFLQDHGEDVVDNWTYYHYDNSICLLISEGGRRI